jgi:hypothetical protein
VAFTVVYLTQVRSMALMIVGCMVVVALVKLRQGHVVQSGWMLACAGGLVVGSFLWAIAVGGDVVQDRFQGIVDNGVVQSYQNNRGIFLDYTLKELVFEYPLGAGLGRWGMMAMYFNEPGNWQNPSLHAEIQVTGWLYDGGILMWLFYGGAIFIALRHSYRLAIGAGGLLSDFATMVLSVQLLIVGLCFTGPVFNSQIGMVFWLLTALLFGCQRTQLMVEAVALEEPEEEQAVLVAVEPA